MHILQGYESVVFLKFKSKHFLVVQKTSAVKNRNDFETIACVLGYDCCGFC